MITRKRGRNNAINTNEDEEENDIILLILDLKNGLSYEDDEEQSPEKKTEPDFSICKEWLDKHLENPYPDNEQIRYFLDNSDLTYTQIKNWFGNVRRRDKRLIKNVKKLNKQKTVDFDHISFSV